MTRQLDTTILRFFTVSRIISPASEMCLCKFHIEIENFLTRRHPPCAQTLSALRFIPQHCTTTHQTHHHHPLHQIRIFKSQHFTASHICVRISCDSQPIPKPTKKPAFPHTFLTLFWFVNFTTERCHPNHNPQHCFPLFPILFFLFTYTSMFCPIF